MSDPTFSQIDPEAVTDAAAHWCMRLHASDCTDDERRACLQWRRAHPLHEDEYQAMLEIWQLSGQVEPANPLLIDMTAAPVAPRQATNVGSWRNYVAAAVLVAVALPVAGLAAWNLGWVPNAYDTYEADDTTRLVTMADGSRVELNLGTRLTFANYKDRRSVVLDKGEAFFEVSHDASHPFIVSAGKGRIEVTGTTFNVWMYEDQVRVMLLEGSVQMVSDAARATPASRLEPGMQASYRSGDFQPQISQTSGRDTSLTWRNGTLVLNDLPLTQALPLINRYLPQPVLLADNATGALHLGGSFNTREMARLVASLPKVLPVTVTRNNDGNAVIQRRPPTAPKG